MKNSLKGILGLILVSGSLQAAEVTVTTVLRPSTMVTKIVTSTAPLKGFLLDAIAKYETYPSTSRSDLFSWNLTNMVEISPTGYYFLKNNAGEVLSASAPLVNFSNKYVLVDGGTRYITVNASVNDMYGYYLQAKKSAYCNSSGGWVLGATAPTCASVDILNQNKKTIAPADLRLVADQLPFPTTVFNFRSFYLKYPVQ